MHDRNKREAAVSTAAGGEAGGVSPKEKIFSIIIRKALEEGITDGRHTLWIDFTPNVAIVKKEDGYVVWLWRDCITIKIHLDNDFNVIGFDVETKP